MIRSCTWIPRECICLSRHTANLFIIYYLFLFVGGGGGHWALFPLDPQTKFSYPLALGQSFRCYYSLWIQDSISPKAVLNSVVWSVPVVLFWKWTVSVTTYWWLRCCKECLIFSYFISCRIFFCLGGCWIRNHITTEWNACFTFTLSYLRWVHFQVNEMQCVIDLSTVFSILKWTSYGKTTETAGIIIIII